jgi:RNA polymerase sigma-70 factor (ECF subfamily)
VELDQAVLSAAVAISPSEQLGSLTLGDFVAAHYDRLVSLARLICRDAADADDAVQLGLERAWRYRATLREADRIRPWLDRIVVNEAIKLQRSRSGWWRRFTSTAQVGWVEPADERGQPTVDISWLALKAIYDRLPPEQRAVVALHLYAGYSVAQTAELVGAPQETVRSRLRMAKTKLRASGGER